MLKLLKRSVIDLGMLKSYLKKKAMNMVPHLRTAPIVLRMTVLMQVRSKILLMAPQYTKGGEIRLVQELHRKDFTILEMMELFWCFLARFLFLEDEDSFGNMFTKLCRKTKMIVRKCFPASILCKSEHNWTPNSATSVMATAIKTVHVATERDSTLLLEPLETRSPFSTLPTPELRTEEAASWDVEDPRHQKYSSGKMFLLLSVEMKPLRRKREPEDPESVPDLDIWVTLGLYVFKVAIV